MIWWIIESIALFFLACIVLLWIWRDPLDFFGPERARLAGSVITVLGVLVTAILLGGWLNSLTRERDATDPPDGRSGLRLLTDHETGCQYLEAGGLHPRLNAAGEHMGCKESPDE